VSRSSSSLLGSLSLLVLASALHGEEKLTKEKLEALQLSALTEAPTDTVRELQPYLDEPDARLGPVIASVLKDGDDLSAEVQQKLFEALKKVADRRVFPQSKELLQSGIPARTRYGIVLLGLTKHPDAVGVLTKFYEGTDSASNKVLTLQALANLGDPAAADFAVKTAGAAEVPDLRDEAWIAAARCGAKVPALALLRANAQMRTGIANVSKDLSYLRRKHPDRYRVAQAKVKELDDRLRRLGPVLVDACRKRPAEVVNAVRDTKDASIAEQFAPCVEPVVKEAPVDALLPLLSHSAEPLAMSVARGLRQRGKDAQQALQERLAEWKASGKGHLRERAELLSGEAGPEVSLPIPANLTPDKSRPEPAVPYLLWDGWRFGKPERDARYYRDLGFTHANVGASVYAEPSGEEAEQIRRRFDLFERYDMFACLRFGWSFGGLQHSWEEMARRGIALRKKRPDGHAGFNPLHPEVIHYYARGLVKTVDAYRGLDRHDRIKWFLVGSERTWDLPKREDVPPRTAEVILAAARRDGVLGPDEDDWDRLAVWWAGPRRKGRDYRLRKAYEDAVLRRIPDARFWVDPIWAVKIVHGFGGDWSYIGNDPKRIADAVVRLKAMCRPAPCIHSTQLIRGAYHDTLLEANLLSICMGADMLYHWGINTFEPGREANPAYGNADWKRTPEGYPWFRSSHFPEDYWTRFVKQLYDRRDDKLISRLWKALPDKVRQQVEEEVFLADGADDELMDAEEAERGLDGLKEPLLSALNEALKKLLFPQDEELKALKPSGRARELIARRKQQARLDETDLVELNRLLFERVFAARPAGRGTPPVAAGIPATPEPSLRQMRESVQRKRAAKEPAIRTTGRLLRDRGEFFRDWQPGRPRMALLGGIYKGGDLHQSLIVGHVPFDLLRNTKDRRERLSTYRFAGLPGPSVSADDYRDLLKIEKAGGTVLVPEGFKPPEGLPTLARPAVWHPKAVAGKTPAEGAAQIRPEVHRAGLRPYFDSENFDIVMQGYTYRDLPALFVVNDLRKAPEGSRVASLGVPNKVDILVRDKREDVRVLNIDTGANARLERREDGWHIMDTIGPAWYRIYAVLGKGETWPGPGPLSAGPEIRELRAERQPKKGAVRLTWKLPFEDWVGCDIARYLIYRSEDGAELKLLADISGRIVTGGGGVINSYLDESARPGHTYTYAIRTVTPLRREGPMSEEVKIGP